MSYFLYKGNRKNKTLVNKIAKMQKKKFLLIEFESNDIALVVMQIPEFFNYLYIGKEGRRKRIKYAIPGKQIEKTY